MLFFIISVIASKSTGFLFLKPFIGMLILSINLRSSFSETFPTKKYNLDY